MSTIAVVGASGQIGTELCIALMSIPNVRVIAICRSRLASALLERCGVECRIGSVSRPDSASELLAGIDTVFDLSFPHGSESESRAANLAIVSSVVEAAPPGASYVYASSYMALGVAWAAHRGERFAYHTISQTAYGAKKRLMERAALAAGRRRARDVYVLRLGQVHGEIQAVSRRVLATIGNRPTAVPAGPSNTVFVCTIAEGLVGIAQGRERPGTYMVTSDPQWTWRELHEYFVEKAGVTSVIVEEPAVDAGAVGTARSLALACLVRRRELITGYLLPPFPDLERRARAWHNVRAASADIASLSSPSYRPYAYRNVGDAPGPRLRTPSDSRTNVRAYADRVRRILLRAAQ
jgi:nucleoside-diphosphate-sugar epimerase